MWKRLIVIRLLKKILMLDSSGLVSPIERRICVCLISSYLDFSLKVSS